MTQSSIKQILDSLNTLQEQLMSLQDDMLLNIDPRNNDSIDKGASLIKAFNNNMQQFSESANNIAEIMKAQFDINPEDDELVQESANQIKRDRLIKELDKTQAFTLKDDFTYKRPYGFVLEDVAMKGIKTWKSMYIQVLNYLYQRDSARFSHLTEERDFISKRGLKLYDTTAANFRVAVKIPGGLYAEMNMSANTIRNVMYDLLKFFNLDPMQMKVYLREDRDATA